MDETLIEKVPAGIKPFVLARAQDEQATLGETVGGLIDDVLGDGWTYEKHGDAFVKAGDRVTLKVVWRALVEEKG